LHEVIAGLHIIGYYISILSALYLTFYKLGLTMFTKSNAISTPSSSSTASESNAETVTAIKYTSPTTDYRYNPYNQTEYFIPALNVGFNSMFEVQSTEAINIPADHTNVLISKSLAEQIVEVAKLNAQLEVAKKALTSSQEYCDLLGVEKPKSYSFRHGKLVQDE
jgi:hypothetical protein